MLKAAGIGLAVIFALGIVKSCSEEFGLNKRPTIDAFPATLVECDKAYGGDNRALMACYGRLGVFRK